MLRIFFVFILVTMLSHHVSPVMAQHSTKIDITAHTGYQRENLDWSIAGNLQGKNPNILSELIWKDLGSMQLGLTLNWNAWNHIMLYAGYSYSSIFSGEATDTDYSQDNRTSPTFNASLRSDKGSTGKFMAGVGYRLKAGNKLYITPYLGYGIHNQSLFLLDDADLNTTYKTTWYGPSGRLLTTLMLTDAIQLSVSINYHQVNYKAEANWDQIPDFQHPVSFRHKAMGYGVEGEILGSFNISKTLSIFSGYTYFKWSTGAGIDELYKTDGNVEKTKLNSVDRNGFVLNAGATLKIR